MEYRVRISQVRVNNMDSTGMISLVKLRILNKILKDLSKIVSSTKLTYFQFDWMYIHLSPNLPLLFFLFICS